MTLTFTIPWSALASDNRKYVALGVLSPEYRQAKMATGLLAKVAARKAKWVVPQGPVTLIVALWEPDHRKRDILNHSKMLCDAVTASEAVWIDDSQIAHATFVRVGTDKTNPRAQLTISRQEATWERETPNAPSPSPKPSSRNASASRSTPVPRTRKTAASVPSAGNP